mmetsp:Transcript_69914/g.130645  ORF Transcript_69914/g.130645 Transcript_69914/m.130645 type:complete len:561 (-) Transcript_69914:97-1779(-)
MMRLSLLAAALAATEAQHHSWDWFYENMCGCTMTQEEGCGMSSQQLFKVLTESPSLEMCERTDNSGDAVRTSHWLDAEEEKMRTSVLKECKAKLKLKELAKEFNVCHDLATEDACKSKPDHCEWAAQDEHMCGMDEEKLIAKFVGDEYKDHPLVKNILIQDACSTKGFEACQEDAKCGYSHARAKCVANNEILYNSFMEHPALFQVLDIQRRGAVCQAWADFVWDGEICWNEECHWERGLCHSNVKTRHQEAPTKDSITKMHKDLCNAGHMDGFGGSQTVGNEVKRCPPTCHENTRNGGCEPDEIDDSKSLELTAADEEVAMYFRVMRSATMIQESRCNSLDNDYTQCRNFASEHLDCPAGYFHPYPAGEERHPQFIQNHNSPVVKSEMGMTPTEKPAQVSDIKNAIDHIANPDGGIGFQGPLGDLIQQAGLEDKGAFLQSFGAWAQDPETVMKLQMMKQQAPEMVKTLSSFWTNLTGPDTPVTAAPPPPPPPQELEAENTGFLESKPVLICGLCLLFAGVFGGFAWGVLCANKSGRHPHHQQLLDTQYVRHQEPGLRNV